MERITPKNFKAKDAFVGDTYFYWARAGYDPIKQVVY